jgi:hypothetical protein
MERASYHLAHSPTLRRAQHIMRFPRRRPRQVHKCHSVAASAIASSSPAGRPALLDENPSCGELNGVFFVLKSAFPDDNARHGGSNCGVSVARFLPSEAKQSRTKSLMLLLDRHGCQGSLAMTSSVLGKPNSLLVAFTHGADRAGAYDSRWRGVSPSLKPAARLDAFLRARIYYAPGREPQTACMRGSRHKKLALNKP